MFLTRPIHSQSGRNNKFRLILPTRLYKNEGNRWDVVSPRITHPSGWRKATNRALVTPRCERAHRWVSESKALLQSAAMRDEGLHAFNDRLSQSCSTDSAIREWFWAVSSGNCSQFGVNRIAQTTNPISKSSNRGSQAVGGKGRHRFFWD